MSGIRELDHVEGFLAAPGPDTFTPVFETLYARLMRYFLLHRLNRASAEELSQDVLMAVYRGAAALRQHELFYGWVFKIARNAFLKHVHKSNGKAETVPLDTIRMPSSTACFTEPGELDQLLSCLELKDREILTLRYIEELTYQEIAEALDLPMGTVKWRLFHAKECLANAIETTARERLKRII